MGVHPGNKVQFEYTEHGIVIKREDEEAEKVFEDIPKSEKKVTKDIEPHEAYESELEDRN